MRGKTGNLLKELCGQGAENNLVPNTSFYYDIVVIPAKHVCWIIVLTSFVLFEDTNLERNNG